MTNNAATGALAHYEDNKHCGGHGDEGAETYHGSHEMGMKT